MSNEEKVTTTEETKVEVDSANTGADVEVSAEKTVERTSDDNSGDAKADDVSRPENNVSVKVENNLPSAPVQHDSNKNYEAAQPVVDPV